LSCTGSKRKGHNGLEASTRGSDKAMLSCATREVRPRIKFEEDKAQIQKEKEQLLMEQVRVKEAVNRALYFVIGLEQIEEDPVESQLINLVASIQQLQ
jgi:hypothetical protein